MTTGEEIVTHRQRWALELLAEGLTYDETARAMFVSPRTVKNDMSALYCSRGLRGKAHAIAWAIRRGIIGMVCQACKDGNHEKCLGCTCQHKVPQ